MENVLFGIESRFLVRSLDRDGKVLQECSGKNHITDVGLNYMANAWAGKLTIFPIPRKFAVGVGTAAVDDSDTALDAEIFRKNLETYPALTTSNKVTFRGILDFGEPSTQGNGVLLTEAGLWQYTSAPVANNLCARALFPTPMVKTAGVQFLIQFEHTFRRAIDLT